MMKKQSKNREERALSTRNLVLSILVIIFFAAIIFVYYRMLYNETQNNIIKNGEITAGKSADQFEQYLSTNVDSIKLTAYTLDEMITQNRTDDEIQDFLVKQSIAIKSAVNENSTGLYGYINGRFFSGTNWEPPEDYVATERPWYTKPMANKGVLTILEPYHDVQSGNTMLALGKTLCDNVSVISVDISLEQVQKMTEEAVISSDSDIEMIINDEGIVVAHSDNEEVGKVYGKERGTLGAGIIDMIHRTDEEYFEIKHDSSHYIVYVAEIQNGWYCVSIKNATEVFGSLNIMLAVTIGIIIIVVLIISIILANSNRRAIIAKRMGQRLASAADIYISMHEIDFLSDSFSEVRNINKEALKMIGNTRNNSQQVINMVMEKLAVPAAREDILDFVDFRKLDERLTDRNTITMEFLGIQNEWRRARFIVSGRLADGRVSRAMFLVEDIDEEKRNRDKLIDMSERAIAANEAKSSFLSKISHEIRTPINAVLGMNEIILRECKDDNIISYSEKIGKAGKTLLGLVNDILDFSKIESGKIEIMSVDYDLAVVINDLINMIQTKADEKGLVLSLDIDRDMPKYLKGDDVRIKQVITNILSNAVKYTEKGSVTFGIHYEKAADEPNSVILNVWIKDTGSGIRPEDMDKLFSEFERIDEKHNRNIEGTGLGMNITKNLLEMMGSTLMVDSVYGLGSKFYFSLKQEVVDWEPLGDYEKAMLQERTRYKLRFTAPEADILVVDDIPMNLNVFESLLKQTKVKIDTAGSGDEGLALAYNKKYDIIFFDHMMPEKDGIETLHELRANKENPNIDTTVVCLTANAISGARENYLVEGFDDYLSKPIDPLKLEDMLLRYLPKDKIVECCGDYDPDDDTDSTSVESTSELPDAVKNIAELDIDAGLKNNGNVNAYIESLKLYASVAGKYSDEIEGYMDAGDYKNATIKIHALKSTSRIIGATDIGEYAQELENAGKSGDTERLKQGFGTLLERCRKLGTQLSPLMDEEEPDDADLPEISDDILNGLFNSIKDYAREFDSDGIEEALKEIKGYKLSDEVKEKCKKITEAADNFDFESIRNMV